MGPLNLSLGTGLELARVDDARRWRERLERAWGVRLHEPAAPWRSEVARLDLELEHALELIDFDEVTVEDRIAFLEAAVAWEVQRALRGGRFDLAIRLQRLGASKILALHEQRHGWRPLLFPATPTAAQAPDRPRFRT